MGMKGLGNREWRDWGRAAGIFPKDFPSGFSLRIFSSGFFFLRIFPQDFFPVTFPQNFFLRIFFPQDFFLGIFLRIFNS